ncbi:hypothetical protein RUND412_008464 [Rhizina undulata]
MPRSSAGSSSSKRQGSHHHLHTHQNGLVPPVKRPNRSRSSSNVGLLSSASSNSSSSQESSPAAAQFHAAVANGTVMACTSNGWEGKGTASNYSERLSEGVNDIYANGVNGNAGGEHRKIDINPMGNAATAAGAASTVLPSFPLLDMITLLIIFLQLPSTVLTIIHFLFASLTFVPPSTTILSASTTSSLPSFTNLLLQGSNGAPSLLTILFADLLVALISMFLWPSARTFLIDFAQAVIAISLGAGYSNQSGGTLRNAAVCAGVMGGVKVVQGRFKLSDAWDSIQPNPTSISVSNGAPSFLSGRVGTSAGWIRSAIAIHIVAQGIMRATRRWLIRRPESGDSSTSGPGSINKDGTIIGKQKDKDPEAAAGATPQPTLERENSSAGSNVKRKKKNQIQYIRTHQPLWATMASAIVHIAQEIEQSQVSSEASNPNPLEVGTTTGESTNGDDARVWITKIGSTEIEFSAGFSGAAIGVEDGYGVHAAMTSGVDGSGKDGEFPLFVRVNGIVWPQTEIYRTGGRGDVDGEGGSSTSANREDGWTIDVTGLTGSTEYDFEFVKKGGTVIYRTSACTMPAQASSAATSPGQQPSRPLSPITTLLNTLAQANSCLAEKRNHVKAVKKAHKTSLSELRKEIERHRSLLGNDRGEERAFRRNLALKEAIKRAEEENEKMSKELEELQSVPEKMKAEWKEKKRLWREEKDRLKSAQNAASQSKAAADRQASAVESEAAALVKQKEKLAARLTKLKADLEKLETENAQDFETREKRGAEREALLKHRASLENEFSETIKNSERKAYEYRLRTTEIYQKLYDANMYQQQQQQAASSSSIMPPSTPDGLPASRGSVGSISTPPGLSVQGNINAITNRERSSSMFSSDSVVTNISELEGSNFVPVFDFPVKGRSGSTGEQRATMGLTNVLRPVGPLASPVSLGWKRSE